MPQLAKLILSDEEGYEYELSLAWDDSHYMEKSIKFDVQCRRRHINEKAWLQPVSVSVSIESDEEHGAALVIESIEKRLYFPLSDLIGESDILDQIPAHLFGGETIVGCLIRSGLSTSVAQIIECKNATRDVGLEWFRPRAIAIFGCMREKMPEMAGTFSMRSFKCVMLGGF